MLSAEGEIRRDDTCLDYSGGSKHIFTYECHGSHGNQEWIYTEVSIMLKQFGMYTDHLVKIQRVCILDDKLNRRIFVDN